MTEHHPLSQTLGAYIGKAGKVMEKRLSENFAKGGFDLHLDHWLILVHLWIKDGQSHKNLCAFAGRHKTIISRTLDSLEQENYLIRVVDEKDRRSKLVYLTHKGRSVQEALTRLMYQTIDEATSGINPADIHVTKKVLNQIFFNLADGELLSSYHHNSFKSNKKKEND